MYSALCIALQRYTQRASLPFTGYIGVTFNCDQHKSFVLSTKINTGALSLGSEIWIVLEPF